MWVEKMIYIKSDLKRAFQIKRVCVGCLGVTFAMFFSIYRMTNVTSVYGAYVDAIYFIPFMLAMTFCAIPFGGSVNEDVECKFLNILLLRGSTIKYVISKVIIIYISAIVTMMLGVFIFVIIIHCKVPWEEAIVAEDAMLNILGESTHGLVYFILHSFFMGLLAANLSIVSAVFSLLWPDKLLQISMPFLLYYLLIYYSGELFPGLPQLNIQFMFNPSYDTWNNKKMSFIFPIIFSGCVAIGMGICMYKQLRRKYGK